MFREALAIRQRALGPHHPHTSTTLTNLAMQLSMEGQHQEAEGLYRCVRACVCVGADACGSGLGMVSSLPASSGIMCMTRPDPT
jgi:hypothetical protein